MDNTARSPTPDEAPKNLDAEEREDVSKRKSGSARVVHEVVRAQGDEELDRPALSLLLSGFAAGVAISFSLLTQAFLHARLPQTPGRELITGFGYPIGFIIVVLGRLQLFTESTVTPVLPVAAQPSLHNLTRLMRLWALVLAANLLGTFAVAWLSVHSIVVSPAHRGDMIEVAREMLALDGWATLYHGIPAGFLVASLAWIMPNARGSELLVVLALTYVIGIGGFSHVVVGSTKAWMLWLAGEVTLAHALFGLLLPALIGNVLGGTGLFALLAHGQVRHEM